MIFDDRDNYQVGWKYNYWELQGIPMRVEVGPKDMADNRVTVSMRDTHDKDKVQIKLDDDFITNVEGQLKAQ